MFFLVWIAAMIATIVFADRYNRSVVGYFFLAMFLGPLALIVVLLLGARKGAGTGVNAGSMGTGAPVHNLAEARRELVTLRRVLANLTERLDRLETRLGELPPEVAVIHPGNAQDNQPALPDTSATAAEVSSTNSPHPAALEPGGFEFTFGKYWLNRIGVVLFVMGTGLFISYSIQYLPAFFKVLTGYVLSAVFLYWGSRWERQARYVKLSWGILAGGWGLIYLSTYAMHFVPITRIISSPLIELLLLAGVSVAAILYNLKYRSWIVSAMTFSLAFITAGLGGLEYATVPYWLLLMLSAAFLTVRCDWPKFLLFSIVTAYLTHHYLLEPKGWLLFWDAYHYRMPLNLFYISLGILMTSWTVIAGTLFLLPSKPERERQIVTATLLNSGLFALIGLKEISRASANLPLFWDGRYWFILALAGLSLLLAVLYHYAGKGRLTVVNLCLGFVFFGLAAFYHFPLLSISYVWLLEVVALFVLGVYYREAAYRMLSGAAGVLVFFRLFIIDFDSRKIFMLLALAIKHNIILFTFAGLIFFLLGALARHPRVRGRLPEGEVQLYGGFPVLATILLLTLLGEEAADRWMTLSWTLLGVAVLGAGFIIHNKVFRFCALCVLSLACLRLIVVDLAGLTTIYKILAFLGLGVVFLTASLIYSKFVPKD